MDTVESECDCALMSDVATANKERFLQAFGSFAAGDFEALRGVLREDFVEHSPGNPSGRDAWLEYLSTSPIAGAQLDLKRVIADDEYVVVHYQLIDAPGSAGVAVVDLWRFEDGLVAEHWDVIQPVPDAAETPNGMF